MSAPARFRLGSIAGGGVLAAGEGSRLRRDGWSVAKPLVAVAGETLVEHALNGFLAAGIAPVAILFNESEADCVAFVRERFGDPVAIHVRTTPSSFESFRLLSSRLPEGRALFSTVDAWCPTGDFVRFAEAAAALPAETTVLAVTPFVDDERPLWVRRGDGGSVTAIGSEPADVVTAGMYLVSQRARELASRGRFDRLRAFLAALVGEGEPVACVEIVQVVDVDRSRDVAAAESLAARSSSLDASTSASASPSVAGRRTGPPR